MATSKSRGLPTGMAETIHTAPVERTRKTYATVEEDEPAPVQEPAPAKKVGRPKKPPRTKKTLYFYHPENIEIIKKGLAKNGDLWLDEESEITDLALAYLALMVSDASKVKSIIDVYEAEIKSASQK
jgi:hypothetical protein